MSFAQLFAWKTIPENPSFGDKLNQKGFIKKKRTEGLVKGIGIGEGSDLMFCCFQREGRVLVMYSEEMTVKSEPKFVMYFSELREMEEDPGGKKGHLIFKGAGQEFSVKFDETKDKDKWVPLFKFFKEKYFAPKDFGGKLYEDDPSPALQASLMTENVSKLFEQVSKTYDYSIFLADKEMAKVLSENPIDSLRNKLFITQLTKERELRKDADPVLLAKKLQEHKNSPNSKDPYSIGIKKAKAFHAVVCSQRAIFCMDKEKFDSDDQMLNKNFIPIFLDFNCISLFIYMGSGDSSVISKQIPLFDIEQAWIARDGKGGVFTVQVLTPIKKYTFKMKSGWEAHIFLEAIINASIVDREKKRCKFGVLRYHLTYFHNLLKAGKEEKIIEILMPSFKKIEESKSVQDFLANLKSCGKELALVCDQFNAYRPFNESLYAYVVAKIHGFVREQICRYWNSNFESLETSEVMEVISGMASYGKVLSDWEIRDKGFENWVDPLLDGYLLKLHGQSTTMLKGALSTLIEPQNEPGKAKQVKITASEIITSHVEEIFDCYSVISKPEIIPKLVKRVNFVMEVFLMFTLKFLRQDLLGRDALISLASNKFFQTVRNLQKRIMADSKGAYTLKQVRDLFNEEFLNRCVNQIDSISLGKLLKNFRRFVRDCMDKEGRFPEINFSTSSEKIIEMIRPELSKIESSNISQIALEKIIQKLVSCFVKKFAENSKAFTSRNEEELIKSLKIANNSFQKMVGRLMQTGSDPKISSISELIRFLETDDLDILVISLLNMQVLSKKLAHPDSVSKCLKAKVFFPPQAIAEIERFFTRAFEKLSQHEVQKKTITGKFLKIIALKIILIRRAKQKARRESPSLPKQPKKEVTKTGPENEGTKLEDIPKPKAKEIRRELGGIGNMVSFDPRTSDEEVENSLKVALTKGEKMVKVSVDFSEFAIEILRDGAKSSELIRFGMIKTVKQMGKNSLFLKTKSSGLAFFFKGISDTRAGEWTDRIAFSSEALKSQRSDPRIIVLSAPPLKFMQGKAVIGFSFHPKEEHEPVSPKD